MLNILLCYNIIIIKLVQLKIIIIIFIIINFI
jgi:hypothetical protein